MGDTITIQGAGAGAGTATAGELLELVRTGRASTRAELGRTTGLSRTAVGARLALLLDAGLVREGAGLASTGGRRPTGLVFAADAGLVLAAALGRSRSQLAVVDLGGGSWPAPSASTLPARGRTS